MAGGRTQSLMAALGTLGCSSVRLWVALTVIAVALLALAGSEAGAKSAPKLPQGFPDAAEIQATIHNDGT